MKYSELSDRVNAALDTKPPFVLVKDEIFEDESAFTSNFYNHSLPIRFLRCKFSKNLNLTKVDFPHGVWFVDTDFCGEACFRGCHFHGYAYFWKCRFHQLADFSHIVVHKDNPKVGVLEVGETNFAYTEFADEASFRHAVFEGPSHFYRTIFNRDFRPNFKAPKVDFEVVHFQEAAIFMGMIHDICIHERELPPGIAEAIFNKADKVLFACEDRNDEGTYYNFNSTIASIQDLSDKLSCVPEPERPAVHKLWGYYANRYMFNGDVKPNFMEAVFGSGSWFRHISLRRCQLRRADFSKTQFDGVRWEETSAFDVLNSWVERNASVVDNWLKGNSLYVRIQQQDLRCRAWVKTRWSEWMERRPTRVRSWLSTQLSIVKARVTQEAVGLHRRSSIYDEIWLKEEVRKPSGEPQSDLEDCDWIHKESMAISRAYHQLRLAADSAGARGLARDFYYGEMEMARKAPPWRSRSPLAFGYKALSGYGTREHMALVVLLLLMLLLFPLTYHCLDVKLRPSHIRTKWAVETTSLEASTFFVRPNTIEPVPDGAKPKVDDPFTVAERFVESVERIFVSVQAGLFVLSLRSRFQRGPE